MLVCYCQARMMRVLSGYILTFKVEEMVKTGTRFSSDQE